MLANNKTGLEQMDRIDGVANGPNVDGCELGVGVGVGVDLELDRARTSF